ncbi:hypothetical protein, partial, partial [Parasitella parasitica]
TNYRTEDCNAVADMKQRINTAQGKFGGGKSKSRKCYNCKEPGWTPAHNLVCKKYRTGKQKVQTAKPIVPMPLTEANKGATEEMDTDTEESEDQHLTFAALNINKDCEYQYLNEPPANLLNKNSIILPITLENSAIKVRTYFLLDTGSSFSCISPKLAQILEVKVNIIIHL